MDTVTRELPAGFVDMASDNARPYGKAKRMALRDPLTGLAMYKNGSSVGELLKSAGGALYKAKADGRNRVECV